MNGSPLILVNHQWQGTGRPSTNPTGADAMATCLPASARTVRVPADPDDSLRLQRGIKGLAALGACWAAVRETLDREAPDRVATVGGDCAADLVPLAWLNQRYQGDLTVLWVDAHFDLNTPASSPSGHAHGMVLRSLLGEGDAAMQAFVPRPLSPAQIIHIGGRSADPEEQAYLARTGLRHLPSWDDLTSLTRHLEAWIAPGSRLHLHVDYDVLDGDQFPDTGVPVPQGVSVEAVVSLLGWLGARGDVVGAAFTEYAPRQADTAPSDAVRRILGAFPLMSSAA